MKVSRVIFGVNLSWLVNSLIFLTISKSFGQTDIPIGTWRMHISYHAIHSITIDDKIYGATENGIMVVEPDDNSIVTHSKINGLSNSDITCIQADPASDAVLIAYRDGDLDILSENEVTNFDKLKNSTIITGSKTINHIAIQNGLAYLSADYGVVVFDLSRNEVKETWRDLGPNGSQIRIFQSTFSSDSIFLATQRGVLAGDLSDNLLDFNNWKRFDQGDFDSSIKAVATFNSKVFAAIDNAGIYSYENGSWTKESFLQDLSFHSLNASLNHLFVIENSNLWKINNSSEFSQVVTEMVTQPLFATEDQSGNFWIGDSSNGLVTDKNGSFESLLANGPSSQAGWRLKYGHEKLYALSGGYSETRLPLNGAGIVNYFSDGIWSQQNSSATDLTDLDFALGSDQVYFVSSMGYGVEQRDNEGNVQFFNDTNSSLINLAPPAPQVYVTSIESATSGLWVANYGAVSPLHVYKGSDGWESFSFASAVTRYPLELKIDLNGYVWMLLDPSQGGGILVFDKDNNRSAYLTDQSGSGGLPSKTVRSIAIDRDGLIWLGTDKGVAYFLSPFSSDAIRPIFENRFLLTDEKITAIKVDGGNRKWIGTERGVWLFNSTGEEQIYNFTTDNSPLLSNSIRDIEIHSRTGEVFFSTDSGIVSFRGTATEGVTSFKDVKIFPNPVTSNFTGTVGITGLASDATVKITDIRGKLIWQTQANGGTATWNVQDYNGKRTSTGVYLVFAATTDGSESFVGKIAVID